MMNGPIGLVMLPEPERGGSGRGAYDEWCGMAESRLQPELSLSGVLHS